MTVPTIELNQYEDWELINSGKLSELYSAVWNREQTDDSEKQMTVATKVAVKLFYETLNSRIRQAIYNDLEMVFNLNLNHKNVIRFFGCVKEDFRQARYPDVGLVMELVEGKSLMQVIHNKEITYSLDEALNWMCQAAKGISYLQSRGLKIRKFRPSNFVMATSDDSSVTVKITKIGVDYSNYFSYPRMGSPEDIEPTWYLAPEVIRGEIVNGPWRDVYAFGIILWEVFARRKPHEYSHSIFDILSAIAENRAHPEPKKLKNVPHQVQELVERCWQHEHGNRPTMEEVGEELLAIRNVLTDEIKNRKV